MNAVKEIDKIDIKLKLIWHDQYKKYWSSKIKMDERSFKKYDLQHGILDGQRP